MFLPVAAKLSSIELVQALLARGYCGSFAREHVHLLERRRRGE
jgi:hypothetical protein